jgi:hypothetical protein
MSIGHSRAAVWFGRVVWLGILANFAFAAPALIAPERVLAMAGYPAASPLMWVRFSAWLLILLSFMYMPGAVDLYRYRVPAWLSVSSRLAGVLFFATQASEYRLLGLFDFVFLVPEAILLTIALRHAPIVDRRLEGSTAS